MRGTRAQFVLPLLPRHRRLNGSRHDGAGSLKGSTIAQRHSNARRGEFVRVAGINGQRDSRHNGPHGVIQHRLRGQCLRLMGPRNKADAR